MNRKELSPLLHSYENPNRPRSKDGARAQVEEDETVLDLGSLDLDLELDLTELEPSAAELEALSLENWATMDEIIKNDDIVKLYFQNLPNRLLSFDEEKELALKKTLGKQAQLELADLDSNAPAEYKLQLETTIAEGLAAREKLILFNTRLVIAFAKKRLSKQVPFSDLIQEGNVGLMLGTDRYDYKRGFRFSTYATWWIRQSINRYITDHSRPIRLPDRVSRSIPIVQAAAAEFEKEHHYKPSYQELAAITELSIIVIEAVFKIGSSLPSLNEQVGEDEEDELGDFVTDPGKDTEEIAFEITNKNVVNELFEELRKPLSGFKERELNLLEMRFGLGKWEGSMTLEEIGAVLGISRERVRQVEHSALNKLRKSEYRRLLKDLWENYLST